MNPLLLSIVAFCLSAMLLRAELSLWRSLTPSALEQPPQVMLVHDGRFLAAGSQGRVFHSTDGRFWDAYVTPTNKVISDLDFFDGHYWATSRGFGVYSSEDGIVWMDATSRFPGDVVALEQGGDVWVATANGGRLWSSTNGVDWVLFDSNLPGGSFSACSYGREMFVAGGSGTFGLWTSPDGREWTQRQLPFDFGVERIRFLNGLFVAVGAEGRIVTSPDGLEWTRQDSKTIQNFYSVTYGAGKYLAVGGQGVIVESTDGVNWTVQPVVLPHQFADIAFLDGHFVLVSTSGATLTSTDGRTWTTPNPAGYNFLDAVAAGPQGWVAVGNLGVILTSPDGRTWERRNSGTAKNLQGVVLTENLIVVVGAEGTVLTSPDGVQWTSRNSGTTRDLNSITFANGQFMTGGPWAVSTNGIDWSIANDNYPQAPEVVYNNGLWVSASHGSILYTSPDALNWTSRAGGGQIFAVTAGPDLFVAGGDSTISISTNGVTWSRQSLPKDVGVRGVAYGGGYYLAVGSAGEVLVSTNGIGWSLAPAVTKRFLRAAAYKDGVFIIVGNDGTILRSSIEDETILTRERLAGAQGFEFRFTSTPGRSYQIQSSPDLNAWTDWQEVIASQTFTVVQDPRPADSDRHYRVLPK